MADFNFSTPDNLQSIYGSWNPDAYLEGMAQQEVRKRANDMSLQEMMMSQDQTRQMNPLKLQEQRLRNQTSEAQLPGVIGLSQQQAVKGRIDQATEQDTIRSKLSEITKGMSDNDLEVAKNAVRQRAMSGDPKAIQAMELFEDVIKEKAKQKYMADRQMELERLRGANQLAAVREGTAGRLAVKTAGASGGTPDVFGQIVSGKIKGAKNIHAALLTAASTLPDDDPRKVQYLTAAEQVRAQAEAEIKAGTPGAVDVGAATGMPTQQGPQIAPPGARQEAPMKSSDYSTWTMQQWKERYPNATDDQIKAAAKAKGYNIK